MIISFHLPNAAFCSQVAGTLNIHWEAVGGDVAPCTGVETTNGVVADATANGSIIMSGVAVSDSSCIGAVAYDFDLSSNTLSLTGSDTLNKIPMTLTRQASEACFVGHWIDGADDYVAHISATAFGILDFDAAPTEFNAAFCSQVAGTLNIHWEAVGGDVAPCTGVETTNGVVADATANGSIIMSGVAVSDSSCIGAVAYDFDLSSNTLSLTGSDTLNKIPMTLTRQASEACFVGHWIDGTDDYVAHISATAFGITPN